MEPCKVSGPTFWLTEGNPLNYTRLFQALDGQVQDSTSSVSNCSCAKPFSWRSTFSLHVGTIPIAAACALPLALLPYNSEKNLTLYCLELWQFMVIQEMRAVRLHGSLKILGSGFKPQIQHTCRALMWLPRAARGVAAAECGYSGPCYCRELP